MVCPEGLSKGLCLAGLNNGMFSRVESSWAEQWHVHAAAGLSNGICPAGHVQEG